MNPLTEWQESAGLSDEGLAALLSDRTEREVPVGRVKRWKQSPSKVPDYVRGALGLDTRDEQVPGEPLEELSGHDPFREGDEPPLDFEPAERRTEPPARKPSTALEPVVPEFDVKTVREVLSTAYSMVGKGAQYAARARADGTKPDYAAVFDAHADRCAEAWVELAKRDAKVARVLVMMTAGGAWGQVVLIHGSLVASLLVVSGKVRLPDGGIPLAPETPQEAANGGSPHEPAPAV